MRPVTGALVALLLTGCMGGGSCTFQGHSIAEHDVWWRAEHPTDRIADVMLANGWRALSENETYEAFEPRRSFSPTVVGPTPHRPDLPDARARYAIALNETASILAYDSLTQGKGGQTLTVVDFFVPGSAVANETEARAAFDGRIDGTLAALRDAFGPPEHSTWRGGTWHCGAI